MSKSKLPKIALVGASGRLGLAIVDIHGKEFSDKVRISHRVQRENMKHLTDDLDGIDAILDVSVPAASEKILAEITKKKAIVPYVIGCTGWTSSQIKALQQTAKTQRIVFAPNFSPGVNLFLDLIERASGLMKRWGYEVLIEETHHNKKKDAPSGTVKAMLEALESTQAKSSPKLMSNPQISSFRAGNIVGTHEIRFVGTGDVLTLNHEALDRVIFARGALLATLWAAGNTKPGFYSMKDVLDLRPIS